MSLPGSLQAQLGASSHSGNPGRVIKRLFLESLVLRYHCGEQIPTLLETLLDQKENQRKWNNQIHLYIHPVIQKLSDTGLWVWRLVIASYSIVFISQPFCVMNNKNLPFSLTAQTYINELLWRIDFKFIPREFAVRSIRWVGIVTLYLKYNSIDYLLSA